MGLLGLSAAALGFSAQRRWWLTAIWPTHATHAQGARKAVVREKSAGRGTPRGQLRAVFVHVEHQRRDAAVPTKREDLDQPQAGALATPG